MTTQRRTTMIEAIQDAVRVLRTEKRELRSQLADIDRALAALSPPNPKYRLSPAVRRRISVAQKRRWAEFRKRKNAPGVN